MLKYLIFEAQTSTEEVSTFEAMASVPEARWPDVHAELAQVLVWCHRWGGAHGAPEPAALDEGGEWDHEISVLRESSQAMDARFALPSAALMLTPSGPDLTRYTVTLTLSGREAFAAAFAAQFIDA